MSNLPWSDRVGWSCKIEHQSVTSETPQISPIGWRCAIQNWRVSDTCLLGKWPTPPLFIVELIDRQVSHGGPSFGRQDLALALLAGISFPAIVQHPVNTGSSYPKRLQDALSCLFSGGPPTHSKIKTVWPWTSDYLSYWNMDENMTNIPTLCGPEFT